MIKGFRQLGQRGRRAPRITLSLTSHLSKIILASQKADAGRSRVASKRFLLPLIVGRLAQLVRASGLHPEGRGSESLAAQT